MTSSSSYRTATSTSGSATGGASGTGSPSTSTISPACKPPALADRTPVDEDAAVGEQRLHVTAAPTGEQGHRAIHPLAVERGRHLDRLVLAHFAGARNVPHTRMIAPIVMHESATLNTGKRPTAMKSTT